MGMGFLGWKYQSRSRNCRTETRPCRSCSRDELRRSSGASGDGPGYILRIKIKVVYKIIQRKESDFRWIESRDGGSRRNDEKHWLVLKEQIQSGSCLLWEFHFQPKRPLPGGTHGPRNCRGLAKHNHTAPLPRFQSDTAGPAATHVLLLPLDSAPYPAAPSSEHPL